MGVRNYFSFTKSRWFIGVMGVVVGVLVMLGVRFATYKSDDVHYHANFAVYLNGQREQFTGAKYYTDVETCDDDAQMMPMNRAHMHDNVNDVVHVEDHAVTWGQFFTNLGWTLGPNSIQTDGGTLYAESGKVKMHVIINNQDYTGIENLANRVIKDDDRLLISYGDEDAAMLKQQYDAIPTTAHRYDVTPDPETCSGHEHGGMRDRFKHMM